MVMLTRFQIQATRAVPRHGATPWLDLATDEIDATPLRRLLPADRAEADHLYDGLRGLEALFCTATDEDGERLYATVVDLLRSARWLKGALEEV